MKSNGKKTNKLLYFRWDNQRMKKNSNCICQINVNWIYLYELSKIDYVIWRSYELKTEKIRIISLNLHNQLKRQTRIESKK